METMRVNLNYVGDGGTIEIDIPWANTFPDTIEYGGKTFAYKEMIWGGHVFYNEVESVEKYFQDGASVYVKWKGIAHNPFEATITNGKVQKFIVNRETGELLDPDNNSVQGWLIANPDTHRS